MAVILDAQGRPIRRPETREIGVVAVRDRWSSYPSDRLTPERLATIFKEADAGDLERQAELMEELEDKDTHLFSVLQTRKNAVLGLDWEILAASNDPTDEQVAAFCREAVATLDVEDLLLDLLDAISKGFSAAEILWGIRDGKAVPTQILWRHQKHFALDEELRLRIRTEVHQWPGELLPPAKYVVHRYKAKSGHPSRAGLGRVVAWMYLFKSFSIKDWVIFAETYGMPLRVGKYDPAATEEDKRALKQAIMQLGADAAGIISKATEIAFIERKVASENIYQQLADFCNREVSKAVLGQTLTTEVGQRGTYAASKTHAEVRQDLLEADAKALAKTLTRDLLRPLVAFNFGDRPVPRWKFHVETPEDLESTARLYATLVNKVGLPVSAEHVYQRFGVPPPERGEQILVPPSQRPLTLAARPDPASPPSPVQAQQALDALASRSVEGSRPAFDRLVAPIRQILDESTDFEDFRARLLERYPELADTREFEDLMTRALFASELFGRWAARGD